MRIVKPSAELVWITPDAERVIEAAGRTCYKSEDKITETSAARFISKIMDSGHHSVIEHASASIRFVCDRGVTHEMVRHRLAAYSQESTRYCNYGKDKFQGQIRVIEPPFTGEDAEHARAVWSEACGYLEEAYNQLIGFGQKPQMARSVLPNCLKTEIVMSCNFREWMHVFSLRTSRNPRAHPQIREVMDIAQALLRKECPAVFGVVR